MNERQSSDELGTKVKTCAIALVLHVSLRDRTMIIISCNIVSPPLRKRNRRPTCSKYRKTQNEQARQTCAIKGASDEVRVVFEDARTVVAQVKLGVKANNGPAEQHARLRLVVWNVAGVLYKLRKIDFVDGEFADFRNKLKSYQHVVTQTGTGRIGFTWANMRWAATMPAPIRRPKGTIEYACPCL
jgi:hypothetical protein